MSSINAVPDTQVGLLETKADGTATLALQTNGSNVLVINSSQIVNCTSNTAVVMPVGTTAQRPASPTNGMFRYSTSNNTFEVYANGNWSSAVFLSPPVNTVAPVISGIITVGKTLTTTNGTWLNSPTSFGYQWRANASSIASATSNTFVLTSTQIGANITCNVTAINAAGSSNAATSNSLGPIVSTYSATYLVVAGGGGGGRWGAGGGGAGGLLTGTLTFTSSTVYTATVGGGGAGATTNAGTSVNGANSVLSGSGIATQTSVGGGGGGSRDGDGNGKSGGSGGGGGGQTQITGGGRTVGQGNIGGNGGTNVPQYPGGGGGGAGAAGQNATGGTASGNGGAGLASSITGTSVTYAGGGGGSSLGVTTGGAGGSGGGGAGIVNGTAAAGNPGDANTGGGGGATQANTGGAGGSGIVVLSVPTLYYSGIVTGSPTVTTNGSNTVIKFTASGTYTA